MIDSGRLCDMQTNFNPLKGKRCFTQLALSSGSFHLNIAEKNRQKTAFRDGDRDRAGFGFTLLSAAFTRVTERALGPPNPDVVSWRDDSFVSSYAWNEHMTTLTNVFTKLSQAHLSVNHAKRKSCAPSQAFLVMIMDNIGVKQSPSNLDAIANMP